MNIDKEELSYELSHLEKVTNIIQNIIDEKNISIDSYKTSVVERKKFLWQNLGEYSEPEMYNAMDEEDLSVNLINKEIVKVYKLYRSLETPYFSKIEFYTENSKDTFYIGLTGIDLNYDPIVYDWRAPVSNLYYNYGLGEAEYESENGIVKGKTILKRQFDIKMGKLENVYDDETGIRDNILSTVLSKNTSDQMKNIVSTIGKEQNDIIRYSGSKSLIVEGVAGSGKTSVALHRIAYLLYNQKDLCYKNVLIFSPSEIFTNYISNVLPELGEENVLTTTFNDFASSYISGKKVESLVEFIERYYEHKNHDDFESVKEKISDKYKKKIDDYLEEYYKSLKFKKKIGLKKTLITAEELNSIKDNVPAKLSLHDKIEYISDRICAKFKIDESTNSSKMYKILVKLLGISNDPIELYQEFIGKEIQDIVRYEDLFGMLYLYFEVCGYPSMSHVKVVAIDEAQDYSLWQLSIIKKIFNRAVFTILGDKNQSINPYLKYDNLEELQKVFKDSKYMRLDKSYRSSKEIMEYANELIGIDDVTSVRNPSGIEVTHKNEQNLAKDLAQDLIKMKNSGYTNIAIITKTETEKNKILKMIDDEKVTVIPVYQAKGLEYDAVIIYTDNNTKYTENEINLLYVAATRALHVLVVYNQSFEMC